MSAVMDGEAPLARVSDEARLRYVLRLGDTNLIIAQRLGAWVAYAPALEEDLGIANVALDLLGQARLLLTYAGELEGRGRSEDELAFARDVPEFLNLSLVEQPNGDFGYTIVRQALFDAYQLELYGALKDSRDQRLADIAAKALKETRYHARYSAGWLVRLGDGTDESHARVQAALDDLWRFTPEFFSADEVDETLAAAAIAPQLSELAPRWTARIEALLTQATLKQPRPVAYRWQGKRGQHSEHLGHLLAPMQFLHRAYPGARW